MKITNCTDKIYTWAIWGPKDSLYFFGTVNHGCEWTHPGQTHTIPVDPDSQLYYWPGKWNAAQMGKFGHESKVVPRRDALILIQGDFPNYVDWTDIEANHITGSGISPKATANLSAGASMASTGLRTVAEIMKFIPGIGTVLNGVLAIAAQIADATSKATTTKSAGAAEMLEAIREIVRNAADRQDAESAAATFLNGHAALVDLDAASLGPHDYDDLKRDAEDFCAAGRDPMRYLTLMNDNPDKSQYIATAYLLGVSTYIQYLWIHFVISIYGGDKITPAKLQAVRRHIQACLDGVTALTARVSAAVEAELTPTKLTAEPYRSTLRKGLYMKRVGLPGRQPFDDAAAQLKAILALLDDDITLTTAGRDATHFFKDAWKFGADQLSPPVATSA